MTMQGVSVCMSVVHHSQESSCLCSLNLCSLYASAAGSDTCFVYEVDHGHINDRSLPPQAAVAKCQDQAAARHQHVLLLNLWIRQHVFPPTSVPPLHVLKWRLRLSKRADVTGAGANGHDIQEASKGTNKGLGAYLVQIGQEQSALPSPV